MRQEFAIYFVSVTCSALTLSDDGVSYNTDAISGRYTVDTVATLTCDRGYSLSGNGSRTCQNSGNWEQVPTCTQSNKNKFYNLRAYSSWFCDSSYVHTNYDYKIQVHRVCQITIAVTCTILTLSNGRITYSIHSVSTTRYPVDTVATFSCNSGYSLSGSSTRTCQTSGNWNQATPTCNKNNFNL